MRFNFSNTRHIGSLGVRNAEFKKGLMYDTSSYFCPDLSFHLRHSDLFSYYVYLSCKDATQATRGHIMGERKRNNCYLIEFKRKLYLCLFIVVSSCLSWLSSASLPQLNLSLIQIFYGLIQFSVKVRLSSFAVL